MFSFACFRFFFKAELSQFEMAQLLLMLHFIFGEL